MKKLLPASFIQCVSMNSKTRYPLVGHMDYVHEFAASTTVLQHVKLSVTLSLEANEWTKAYIHIAFFSLWDPGSGLVCAGHVKCITISYRDIVWYKSFFTIWYRYSEYLS